MLPSLFFSINLENSLPRVLKILIIISFIVLIKKNITNYKDKFERIIFGSWAIIFLFVTLDIILEIIFGYNIIEFYNNLIGYSENNEKSYKRKDIWTFWR